MLRRHDFLHDAADAGQNINSREMSFIGKITVQYDVSVKNPPDCIGDGLIHIVTVHQYGVESGNGAFGIGP
ncbi:hypothetical protein D3C76_1512820 [compost metagenome]